MTLSEQLIVYCFKTDIPLSIESRSNSDNPFFCHMNHFWEFNEDESIRSLFVNGQSKDKALKLFVNYISNKTLVEVLPNGEYGRKILVDVQAEVLDLFELK